MIKLKTASKEFAQNRIVIVDDYIKELTEFNIQIITNNECMNTSDFISYLPSTCVNWPLKKAIMVSSIEKEINDLFLSANFNFDLDVNLICTNGKDSFNLPYTRGNDIYIPNGDSDGDGYLSTDLIIHEIFHIISRKYPQIRENLYGLMGFTKMENKFDIERGIPTFVTNPDALEYEYAMTITQGESGNKYELIPMIYFKYNKMCWVDVAILSKGELIDIVHRKKTGFSKKQYNTDYLSHPEEICAENFRKWITNCDKLNNEPLVKSFADAMRGFFN